MNKLDTVSKLPAGIAVALDAPPPIIPKKTKKKKKKKKREADESQKPEQNGELQESRLDAVEIEYVSNRAIEGRFDEKVMEEFSRIFNAFSTAEELCKTGGDAKKEAGEDSEKKDASKADGEEGDEEKEAEDEDAERARSKKQRKREKRLKISELKQLVRRPDVVESWDVTATDPRLLVYLKAYRNTVPVPRHWCQKRKYLQGKRGIEKAPFKLPDFIEATGIAKIRASYQEKEDQKKLKQKQREKMAPKLGKMDIDYQVLHDAFFKFQTKPKLTIHGDLYYEGKEFEIKMKEKKPGALSEDLKKALGMTEGSPPPWLINMQRYGPPPSYPNLKIPGLNAPIPPGTSYGYHSGGWGKPPVDEHGRGLYGDVFGLASGDSGAEYRPDAIDRTHWGEIEEEEEEEEEKAEDQEEVTSEAEGAAEEMETGAGAARAKEVSLADVEDGISSVPSGLETPDVAIDLRKSGKKSAADEAKEKALFQVLEEQQTTVAGGLLGTQHRYNVSGAKPGPADAAKKVDLIKSQKTQKVEITLNPDELENLGDAALAAKYDEKLKEERAAKDREDVSDVIDEEQRKKKRKAQQQQKKGDDKSKKYKDFKF
eukprot:CAMPEP_0184652234 /NCGR_PEP_ID=MMETSP0308-20130426/9930_1 /TAXON_ID=38269 /ORGANISM="Gloeochaete witrockiana, Strain SAG 46.84" /LENGTH=597 /DNA_ID=CAMNT_0027086995 /DNA_START=81 /DNA_END=1874 /DNA_ORIENTATION=-